MAETFAFGELSAGAKEKALEAHREQLDYAWWDSIYEEAARVGGLLGIEIYSGPSRTTRTHGNKAAPDIQFSGFSSQGDGASFSGTLWIENFPTASAKTAQDYPTDTELEILARRANEIFEHITAVHVAQRLMTDEEFERGDDTMHYADCYPAARYNVERHSRGHATRVKDGHYALPHDIEDALNKLCEDFADWIYTQLEQEYEYRTSDEQTIEHIEDNEMMFYEDGSDV